MLSKREEFYAKRRSNRHKSTHMDPYAMMEYIKLGKEYEKNNPPDPAKKALMKSAIENLIIKLRIKKIKFEYHKINQTLWFWTRRGSVYLKWDWHGYITTKSNNANQTEVKFMVTDCRDIVDKLVRFDVIYREDFT